MKKNDGPSAFGQHAKAFCAGEGDGCIRLLRDKCRGCSMKSI